MTMDIDAIAQSLRFRYGGVISQLKARARATPWDGRASISAAHRFIAASWSHPEEVNVSILFTFDYGAHSSGWWRNSDYERCWHLSLAGMNATLDAYEDLPDEDRRAWPRAFFGGQSRMAWWEPPAHEGDPYRSAAASRSTHHVRLFVDRTTGQPIIPTGEVYTLKPWSEGDSPEKVFR